MNNDINQIINGDIDLYEFLGIAPDATEQEIKRQYRKKALRFHPDKYPGNEDKFDLLLKVYEILNNESLKKSYDKIRQIKRNKKIKGERLDELTKQFKSELEKAEKEHRLNNDLDLNITEAINKRKRQNTLERLKEEGLKRRRLYESSIIKSSVVKKPTSKYISFKDIPVTKLFSIINTPKSNRVIVKWKHKSELKNFFTSDILKEIMEIFGTIRHSDLLPTKNSRYDSGIIEYENYDDAEKAVNHNYKKSASLWDGTSVRKLASLLRDCKFEDGCNSKINKSTVFLDDTNKMSKDFTIGSNDKIDAVLHKLIIKQSNNM